MGPFMNGLEKKKLADAETGSLTKHTMLIRIVY
jgi:hypothetical protein